MAQNKTKKCSYTSYGKISFKNTILIYTKDLFWVAAADHFIWSFPNEPSLQPIRHRLTIPRSIRWRVCNGEIFNDINTVTSYIRILTYSWAFYTSMLAVEVGYACKKYVYINYNNHVTHHEYYFYIKRFCTFYESFCWRIRFKTMDFCL